MPQSVATKSSAKNLVFIVTIRRSERSEPEAHYMPAPTPAAAELRVRRLAKAPQAAVLSIRENRSPN